MNIELFSDVLKQIQNPQIREFTIRCLKSAPEYLEKIPASSTGKYHPKVSLGEGGLVRHILRACQFANILMQANDISPEDIRGDVIYSALLLHDIGKKDKYKIWSEYNDHPVHAIEYLKPHKDLLNPKVYESIKNAVKWHMGKWSGKSFAKPMTEYTLIELIVYNSDYLSSKKELDFIEPTH